jgi:hypothetical protein
MSAFYFKPDPSHLDRVGFVVGSFDVEAAAGLRANWRL